MAHGVAAYAGCAYRSVRFPCCHCEFAEHTACRMKLDCQRGVGAYCIVLREILEANVGSFYKIFARLYIDVACPVDIGKYGFVARA